MKPDGLCCDHCGDVAIEFRAPAHGVDFWHLDDGDGGQCMSCGYPGQVMVYDGEEGDISCRWAIDEGRDDARCTRPECDECGMNFDLQTAEEMTS